MLFDTDILIWVLRGHRGAAGLIDDAREPRISVVTWMELAMGARSRAEMRSIKDFLGEHGFIVLPLSENIGHRAAVYVEEYGLGSGLSVGDALIAATAVEEGVTLCTGNVKRFRVVKDLALQPFRPR